MAVLLLLAAISVDRPNIVFLMADDLATSGVGCYGNPHVRTPNIDALAADGLTFDRHYVTTAICMASRASVFTGLYEYRHGCNFHAGPLSEADWRQAYPVLLRKAGYRTAFAGKFGLTVSDDDVGPERGSLPAGDFDAWGGGPGQTFYETNKNRSVARYADEYPHSSRAYGAFAADFIRESAAADAPFCLSISFKAPHRPVKPSPMFDDWYDGQTFPRPSNFGREAGLHQPPQSRMGRQYPRFVEWGYADRYDEVMADYFRLVAGVDSAVGMIRAAIDAADVRHETVVIVTSDNGYLCGSHGLASKVLPYEESARVPLIVFDPRQPGRGRRTKALTAGIDFTPTMLELAGIDDPVDRDGVSLLPILADPEVDTSDRSVALIDVWNPEAARSLAVVKGRHKYVAWPGNGEVEPAEELYDLESDPGELSNIRANDQSMDAMRAEYDRHLRRWEADAVDRGGYRANAADFRRPSTSASDSASDGRDAAAIETLD